MTGRLWRALLMAGSARFWVMVGAAMALTAFAAAVVAIITWRWPPDVDTAHRLTILGGALWIMLAGIIIVVIALTGKRVDAGGVWGHLNVQDGTEDPHPPSATVTTTVTKTETKP